MKAANLFSEKETRNMPYYVFSEKEIGGITRNMPYYAPSGAEWLTHFGATDVEPITAWLTNSDNAKAMTRFVKIFNDHKVANEGASKPKAAYAVLQSPDKHEKPTVARAQVLWDRIESSAVLDLREFVPSESKSAADKREPIGNFGAMVDAIGKTWGASTKKAEFLAKFKLSPTLVTANAAMVIVEFQLKYRQAAEIEISL